MPRFSPSMIFLAVPAWRLLILISAAVLLPAVILAQTIIADNDDGPPGYGETGTWTTSSQPGFNNLTYGFAHPDDGLSTATWYPEIPVAQAYDVRAHLRSGGNRSSSALYRIVHIHGTTELTVDQRGENEITFRDIGRYEFDAGSDSTVTVTTDGSDGFVIADAVEFLPVDFPLMPVIVRLTHQPQLPTPDDTVTVEAEVDYPAEPGAEVSLTWRRGSTDETTIVPMTPALKGTTTVYTATIPSQPEFEFVEYGVEAAAVPGFESVVGNRVYQVLSEGASVPLVFLVAGQSNACGPGELNENNETSDPAVLMFGQDYEWKIAYEPITDAVGRIDTIAWCPWTQDTERGHGFGLRATKELLDTGVTCRLIPCARAGSSLTAWQKPADLFDRSTLFGSMNYRRFVSAPDGVDALWWYQGERDIESSSYTNDHRMFIASVREEMGAGLPVLAAQLTASINNDLNPGMFATGEKQRRMETGSGYPEEIADHHLVVTFDLPMLDHYHLDQDATKELGRRFALATREHVLGEEGVDGTGPRLRGFAPVVRDPRDSTRILVTFDREVTEPVATAKSHFRAGQPDSMQAPLSATRHPARSDTLVLQMNSPVTAVWEMTYGASTTPSLHTMRTDVLKGVTGLPVPRFGPLPVGDDPTESTTWMIP